MSVPRARLALRPASLPSSCCTSAGPRLRRRGAGAGRRGAAWRRARPRVLTGALRRPCAAPALAAGAPVAGAASARRRAAALSRCSSSRLVDRVRDRSPCPARAAPSRSRRALVVRRALAAAGRSPPRSGRARCPGRRRARRRRPGRRAALAGCRTPPGRASRRDRRVPGSRPPLAPRRPRPSRRDSAGARPEPRAPIAPEPASTTRCAAAGPADRAARAVAPVASTGPAPRGRCPPRRCFAGARRPSRSSPPASSSGVLPCAVRVVGGGA